MNNISSNIHQYNAIAKTLQYYIDGVRSGKGDDMKPGFHKDATMFAYSGTDLMGGPIQSLFDWSDTNGPAADLQAQIASIDIADTVAIVRLELTNVNNADFTDMFTLLKINEEWTIMSKVFHVHT